MIQSFTVVPCVTEVWPMTRFGFGGGNGGSSPPGPGSGGSAFAAEAKLSAATASTAGSAMRRNVWIAFMVFPLSLCRGQALRLSRGKDTSGDDLFPVLNGRSLGGTLCAGKHDGRTGWASRSQAL